jgi:large subunit ribosomal protein L15
MENFTIKKPAGATRKKRILGRGPGSGRGCTAGKGDKGQNSRSGGGVRPGFEGGQMPLYRRIARRGFSNYPFKKEYLILNLKALEDFADGEKVNRESLINKGLIKNKKKPIKILGQGEVSKKLMVEVDRVSASAQKKIVDSGGEIISVASTKQVLDNGK